ncbi:MAG: hypothetical protein J7518_19675 [Nocardioidaceae bacterium]|nr:hypothetical protein [Nocardioidaceae bacterium]
MSETWQVHNEFASVSLRVVPHGRGSRLEITSGRLEHVGLIDPTVLEALTLLDETALMQIVAMATDPGTSPEDH